MNRIFHNLKLTSYVCMQINSKTDIITYQYTTYALLYMDIHMGVRYCRTNNAQPTLHTYACMNLRTHLSLSANNKTHKHCSTKTAIVSNSMNTSQANMAAKLTKPKFIANHRT